MLNGHLFDNRSNLAISDWINNLKKYDIVGGS